MFHHHSYFVQRINHHQIGKTSTSLNSSFSPQIFGEHPLKSLDTHCNATVQDTLTNIIRSGRNLGNFSEATLVEDVNTYIPEGNAVKQEPNTALLSAILMFGTFFIAYFLRIFRNGKYLGRTVSL